VLIMFRFSQINNQLCKFSFFPLVSSNNWKFLVDLMGVLLLLLLQFFSHFFFTISN
jgi:hypothetical protein